MVDAYIFSIKNKRLLCIVDFYSKFPTVKTVDGLLEDDLIRAAKSAFSKFGLPKKSPRCRHIFHIRLIETVLQAAEH